MTGTVQRDEAATQTLPRSSGAALEGTDLLSSATTDLVRDWDVRAGVVHWNGSLEQAFGHYVPAPAGASMEWWFDFVHPDDRASLRASLEAALAADATSWSAAYRFRRADDSYAHVLDRSYLLRDAAGRVVTWSSLSAPSARTISPTRWWLPATARISSRLVLNRMPPVKALS